MMKHFAPVVAVAAIALGGIALASTAASAAPASTQSESSAYAYSEPNYGGAQYSISSTYTVTRHERLSVPVAALSVINHTPWGLYGYSKDLTTAYLFHPTTTGGYNTIGAPFTSSGNLSLRSFAFNM
jgi:hypothetical protein